jgi:hypothetical protein
MNSVVFTGMHSWLFLLCAAAQCNIISSCNGCSSFPSFPLCFMCIGSVAFCYWSVPLHPILSHSYDLALNIDHHDMMLVIFRCISSCTNLFPYEFFRQTQKASWLNIKRLHKRYLGGSGGTTTIADCYDNLSGYE